MDSIHKQLGHSKNGSSGRSHGSSGWSLVFHQKDGSAMQRWKCKSYKQIFTLDENLIKHVKEGRCAGGITKIISSGSKLRHILNSSKKVFYGSDKKLSYTACQWNKAEVADIGNRIHHKMCGMVEKTYSLIHYYLFFLFFNVDMKYVTVKLNTSTPAQSRFRGFKSHSGQQLSIATLNNPSVVNTIYIYYIYEKI